MKFATATQASARKSYGYWLPLFLSVKYGGQPLVLKQEANDNGRFTLQLNVLREADTPPITNPLPERLTTAMEKSLSSYHEDVAEAILICGSPCKDASAYGIMKDAHSKSYYVYDIENKVWNIGVAEILERDKFIKYLSQSRTILSPQIHESHDEAF